MATRLSKRTYHVRVWYMATQDEVDEDSFDEIAEHVQNDDWKIAVKKGKVIKAERFSVAKG